jgi:hypothetical protein
VVRISIVLAMVRSLVGTFNVGADVAVLLKRAALLPGRPDLSSEAAGLRFDTDQSGRAPPRPARRVAARAAASRLVGATARATR